MAISGDLILLGSVEIFMGSGDQSRGGFPAIELIGDFRNESTTPEGFDLSGGVLTLAGPSVSEFEVGGDDLGATPAGFWHPGGNHRNFSLSDLVIASNSGAIFKNDFDNSFGGGDFEEALYVGRLELGASSALTVRACNIYYGSLQQDPTATIIQQDGGNLLRIDMVPPGEPPSSANFPKNRYISLKPNNPGLMVKLKVTLTDSLPHPGSVGNSWWVQAPIVADTAAPKPLLSDGECAALLGPENMAAEIDWSSAGCQTLHVTGCPIEPTSEYDVTAVLDTIETTPLTVPTILKPGAKWWGDTVGFFDGAESEWTPPQGATNIDDAVAAIKTFQGGQVVPPGPIPPGNVAHLAVADVDPGDINAIVNFNDVFTVVLAFQGDPYPFGPADADGNCP